MIFSFYSLVFFLLFAMRLSENSFRFLAATLLLGSLMAFHPAAETRETRELSTFTAVRLGTRATVLVRQGSPQRVVVEAASDDLPKLRTEVVNNQLRIYTEMTSTQIAPSNSTRAPRP